MLDDAIVLHAVEEINNPCLQRILRTHMAWTPDGNVMAVAAGFRGSIWKFTPEGK
jgi:hypothetical protein